MVINILEASTAGTQTLMNKETAGRAESCTFMVHTCCMLYVVCFTWYKHAVCMGGLRVVHTCCMYGWTESCKKLRVVWESWLDTPEDCFLEWGLLTTLGVVVKHHRATSFKIISHFGTLFLPKAKALHPNVGEIICCGECGDRLGELRWWPIGLLASHQGLGIQPRKVPT